MEEYEYGEDCLPALATARSVLEASDLTKVDITSFADQTSLEPRGYRDLAPAIAARRRLFVPKFKILREPAEGRLGRDIFGKIQSAVEAVSLLYLHYSSSKLTTHKPGFLILGIETLRKPLFWL